MSILLIDIRGKMNQKGVFPYLTVGDAYYGRVTADGGTPFYTYTIIDGSLPAGLSLDNITGEVTGTPTDNLMAAITVRATDLQGMYVDASYVIPGAILIQEGKYTSDMIWRYKKIPYSSPFPSGIPAEATIGYDDSSWLYSLAPFGDLTTNPSVGTRAHAHDSRLPSTIGTFVPKDSGVWLRRNIRLTSVPSVGLPVKSYIDNYLRVYVNGTVGFSVNNYNDGPADVTIPSSNLKIGDNLFAAWCMDDSGTGSGDAAYYGFVIDLP